MVLIIRGGDSPQSKICVAGPGYKVSSQHSCNSYNQHTYLRKQAEDVIILDNYFLHIVNILVFPRGAGGGEPQLL